jgi:hypothetical protein
MTTDAIKDDGNGPYLNRDPRSRLPVSCDWSAWLTQEATTIASSAWTADAGITLDTETHTTTAATVFLSGGVEGQTYRVRNTITTANGLVDSRSFRVGTRDR